MLSSGSGAIPAIVGGATRVVFSGSDPGSGATPVRAGGAAGRGPSRCGPAVALATGDGVILPGASQRLMVSLSSGLLL